MINKFLRKNKNLKVLAFAREAGGAAAIAPVCQLMLKQGWRLLLLAKGNAEKIFRKRNLDYLSLTGFNESRIDGLVKSAFNSLPDIVFTSATSLPHLDMSERYLWKWGQKHKILTIGLLDQWQNYALRFSGTSKKERLAYLPDYIFAMDRVAKREMVAEGIPRKRIIIAGQPAFDHLAAEVKEADERKKEIKSKLKIKDGVTVITFVAEAMKKDFKNRLGYDEHSTLKFLGGLLERLCQADKGLKICLMIKLHPENNPEEFRRYLDKWSSFEQKIVNMELTSFEIISISDIVVGMTSVMLLESILAGKVTVSIQLNSLTESQLVATKIGAIPFIKSKNTAKRILKGLLISKRNRSAYLKRQKKLMMGRGAAKNCINKICLLANKIFTEPKLITDESYNISEVEVDASWINDLGRDYLEYRKKWTMANKRHLFDFPLFLEVETSYACNYRCPKCPRQALKEESGSGFLSRELLDKLFEEVKRYKMPSITLSHGGEPLMRKDLPELIRKAKESGIIDRMFHTNGSLLNKKLSRELIENGLTKINFSLDAASPGVYAKVRPGGDYGQVVKNINDFLRIKKEIGKSYPRVRVSFVVSDENRHEQKKFYDLWKDKVNVISFQKCYDFSKITSDEHRQDSGLARKPHCTQLWQLLTITYKGDIIVCEHDYKHEYVLGNLRTHTIYECWNSLVMNKFRKLHASGRAQEIPLCRRCLSNVGD